MRYYIYHCRAVTMYLSQERFTSTVPQQHISIQKDNKFTMMPGLTRWVQSSITDLRKSIDIPADR